MTDKIYAFPSDVNLGDEYEANWTANGGMTLRDYFAAKAMNGELSSMTSGEGQVNGLELDTTDEELYEIATHWYRIADAMMEARSK